LIEILSYASGVGKLNMGSLYSECGIPTFELPVEPVNERLIIFFYFFFFHLMN
jgi:hypothetical protein